MRIYVLDDEPIALRGSVKIIQETVPEAEIKGFGRARAAFKHIKESREYPDVVFSDIEMPGMSGLDFAVQLKQLCPDTILIFVTAYSQYALEAFRLHVHGYILKPLTSARVREELDYGLKRLKRIERRRSAELPQEQDQTRVTGAGPANSNSDQNVASDNSDQSAASGNSDQNVPSDNSDQSAASGNDVKVDDRRKRNREEKLQVQCFGKFEVYWRGMPIMFSRAQTMELFAYLIDRKGAVCTEEEIAGVLWPEEAGKVKSKNDELKSRVHILTGDLRRIFGSIGREDFIIHQGDKIAVRKEAIDCDYYRMLSGDMDAVNDYQGEYMSQYSWAEIDV